MTEQNKTEELLKEYWNSVIEPTLKIPMGFSHFSNEGGYVQPSIAYKSYKKSDYYYEGKNKFLHYTSLDNAINIINEGCIRMNDISLLDDPQELIFAGKPLFNKNIDEFREWKSRTFCLSMCEEENFDMWRLYGDNGWGVALTFKFLPDFEEWKNSFISKIYYEEQDKLDIFDDLVKRHNEFHQTHKILIKDNFREKQNKLLAWISIFMAFHKTSLYKNENEVRFVKFDFSDFSYKNLGCTKNKDFAEAFYYKLPIVTKENLEKIATRTFLEKLTQRTSDEKYKQNIEEGTVRLRDIIYELKKGKIFNLNFKADEKLVKEILHNSEPIILIEKIVFGYRYNNDKLREIEKSLRVNLAMKTGFIIEIERTPLAEKFHPKK